MAPPLSTNPISELYNRKIADLFFRFSRLSLSTMSQLAEKYGHPEKGFKSVHIAGSNGKGSVAVKMAKALEKEGYKIGLYTSPHISTFRERIQINSTLISEETVLRLLPDEAEGSFFELATLLAFRWFNEEKVDFAIIETGLGGRLDATNIIQPEIAIITSISLEHTEILGSTIEEIAAEKGGILKSGVPALIGPRAPAYPGAEQLTGSFDSFDEENSAIAKRALELLGISAPSIEWGLSHRPPCRFEKVGAQVILDVAHNPDGMRELVRCLKGEKVHIVLALSKTKDIPSCLKILNPFALSYTLTESPNGRTLSCFEIKRMLAETGFPESKVEALPNVEEALDQALLKKGTLLVTGTFFIMSAARRRFFHEPLDFADTNERLLPKTL